jgi:tetratricopeptide (TPR) repeat protein
VESEAIMSQSDAPSDDAATRMSGNKTLVGYKHPPANKRFATGRSGNPKGRPKGTPNVADILKALFNKKVPVREGARPRMMKTCEAIIRLAVVKARHGDARALTTVLTILEKLGATKDVTSEERQNRTITLSRAHTMEEYDLLYAPAREKERQYYSAIVECDEKASDETTRSFIRAGDELAAQGRADEALAIYCQQIALGTSSPADETNDPATLNDYKRALNRIGLLADRLLQGGDFATALTCADKAVASGGGFNITWIHLVRAHANMFLGKSNEARDFYLSFQSQKNVMFTSWETIILRDFARLQKAGHSHPLMTEIEKKLIEAGWTTEGRGIAKVATHTVKADDQQFMMLNPDHVQTVALFAEQGKLDEAAGVYWRNLVKCQTRLAKEPGHTESRQLLDLAVARLGVLAEQFVHRGRFATALELTKELIAVASERCRLRAIRAHAMMFLGREDDAQALYLRYRGQKIGSELWEATVLADFNKFRQTGRSHPLMDKVERLFESKDWLQSTNSPPLQNSDIAREVSTPQADDIPAGDRLLEQGKLDEALDVYCRRIEISQAKLVNGRVNLQAIEDRQIAIERISDLAFAFVLQRDFQKSIAVTDKAIGVLPNSTSPNLRRAHALMLLNRTDEARELYRRFGVGKATPELTWQDVIRHDFSVMRNAGLTHALMAEIEGQDLTAAPVSSI